MKKLIIITILLLLQSFPSIGSPNGKGLVCECYINCENSKLFTENYKLFLFEEKQVVKYYTFERSSDKIISRICNITYRTLPTEILIRNMSDNVLYTVNRKTLEIVSSGYFDTPILKYTCNIIKKNEIPNTEKMLINKIQNVLNEKMKDNKI